MEEHLFSHLSRKKGGGSWCSWAGVWEWWEQLLKMTYWASSSTCLPTALKKPRPSFLIPPLCPWTSYGGVGMAGREEEIHEVFLTFLKAGWNCYIYPLRTYVSLLLGVIMLFPDDPPCFSCWPDILMAVSFVFDYYRMMIKVSYYFTRALVQVGKIIWKLTKSRSNSVKNLFEVRSKDTCRRGDSHIVPFLAFLEGQYICL